MEKQKILLLDDDRFIRAGLGKELGRDSFQVITAESGEEAIEILENENFDAYIIDIVLDGIDGLEVVRRIREDRRDAVILILTGYGDMNSAVRALRLGVDDFLEKPCDPVELRQKLRCRVDDRKPVAQREITKSGEEEIRRLEQKLEQCKKEYETKMREIHHRVKNNFSLISALLNLQQSSVHDPGAQFILKELNERINAFSLIHQMMYENSEYSEINIQSYLQELATRIVQGMTPSSLRVSSRFRIDPVLLPTEKALPLGLITTELVMNALEHGFGVMDLPVYYEETETARRKTQEDLSLSVTFSRSSTDASEEPGPQYSLTVFNTGFPFPEEMDIDSAQSMGFQIVNSLALQLGGTVSLRRLEEGTEIEISFPVEKISQG